MNRKDGIAFWRGPFQVKVIVAKNRKNGFFAITSVSGR